MFAQTDTCCTFDFLVLRAGVARRIAKSESLNTLPQG